VIRYRWVGLAVGGAALGVLGLRAAGVVRARGSVVFLAVVLAVSAWTVRQCVELARGHGPWLGARRWLLAGTLVAVPVAFNLRVLDSFNLVKLTLLLLVLVGVVATWLLELAVAGRRPQWRSGFEWPLLVLVLWTALATAAGVSPRFSALGAYGTRDGLVSAVAYAILLVAVVDSFRAADVGRLLRIALVGGGGLAAAYGLVQLADRYSLPGAPWDWLRWNPATFPPEAIWSTLGNPNHLGAFAAVMVPVGVVCIVTAPTRSARIASGVVTSVLGIELVHTRSSGAWLAGGLGLVAMLLLLAPELRRRPGATTKLAVTVGALGMVGLLVVGPSTVLDEATSIFDVRGPSTINQRFGYWQAGLRMAGDRPLLGAGPDAYQLLFSHFQDAAFVQANGPAAVVNGPHNVFLAHLVAAGVPALVAFVLLLGVAVRLVLRTRPRLQEAAAHGGDGLAHRVGLAGVAGALVASVVQASVNVAVVPLSVLFWVLLGLLAVLARDAGVPLRRRAGDGGPASRTAEAPAGRRPSSGRVAGAGVVVGSVTIVLALLVTLPYRAERVSFTGHRWRATANAVGSTSQAKAREALIRARTSFVRAALDNPWEATYRAQWARTDAALASATPLGRAGERLRNRLLIEARDAFERTLALDARSWQTLNDYAELEIRIAELYPADRDPRDRAIALLEEAIRENPWQPNSPRVLAGFLERNGDASAAVRVLDRALARAPENLDLLRQTARLKVRSGDQGGSTALWLRVLSVTVGGDPEARAALGLPPG